MFNSSGDFQFSKTTWTAPPSKTKAVLLTIYILINELTNTIFSEHNIVMITH